MGIDIKDHVNTLFIFARWVDSAISKTVNIPTEFSFEQFKNVYLKAYDTGFIKGCTTYRVGTMASVLSEKSSLVSAQPSRILKRPKTLDCDIIHLTYQQKPWTAFVGLLDNKPYEVFAMKARKLKLSQKIKHGRLTKTLPGKYDLELDDGTILEDICEHFEKDEEEAITRLISTALRYGVEIESIIDQLMKSQGTIVSFSKVIARTLKRYLTGKLNVIKCSYCKSRNMQMVDGCPKCNDCGKSKCD
jgi:ribonucleoside-diphosphate reductase alpha chain